MTINITTGKCLNHFQMGFGKPLYFESERPITIFSTVIPDGIHYQDKKHYQHKKNISVRFWARTFQSNPDSLPELWLSVNGVLKARWMITDEDIGRGIFIEADPDDILSMIILNSYPAGFYLSNLEVTLSEVRDE